MAGWPDRMFGLATGNCEVTPTLFQVDSGMLATSLTTWAGAGVTGV